MSKWVFGWSDRDERLSINLELDKNKYDKWKEHVNALTDREQDRVMCEGDVVKVHYTFDIHYIDGITRAFEALIEMIEGDPTLIKHFEKKEVNYGEYLVEKLFEKFKVLRDRLDSIK